MPFAESPSCSTNAVEPGKAVREMVDILAVRRGAREERLWEPALAARRHEHPASYTQGLGVLPERDSMPS